MGKVKNCATGHCRKPEQDRRQCPYHVKKKSLRLEAREVKRRKKITTCPNHNTPQWVKTIYAAVRYELRPDEVDYAILEGMSFVQAVRSEVIESQNASNRPSEDLY